MEMVMKKDILIFLVLITGLLSPCDQACKNQPKVSVIPQTELTKTEVRAQMILKEIVQTHPSKEIREELDSLIQNGIILLCFRSNIPAREMYFDPTARALIINPEFLLSVEQDYLYLVLAHEWEHVKDFLKGNLVYFSRVIPKDPGKREKLARSIWENEFRAIEAEWELAKQLRRSDLMPDILIQEVEKNGEEKGLKTGLFKLLLVTRDPEEVKICSSWWKQWVKN